MEIAQKLITELGRYIGIEGLQLDEQGLCTLVFDENLMVTFVANEERLSTICYIAKRSDEAFLRQLLEANFAWRETGGGTFAIEPDSSHVVLSRSWAFAELTFQRLIADLEGFVNVSESWQKFAADDSNATAPNTNAPSANAPNTIPPTQQDAITKKKPAQSPDSSAPTGTKPEAKAQDGSLPRPGTRYV